MSVFMGFCRTHSVVSVPPREPWRFGEPTRSRVGAWIRFRYRLLPYLYTLAHEAALTGAHVLYVKEWGATACYGDAAADARLRSALTGWCVREDWFSAAPQCHVMHCLPVRRNVAIAGSVLDSARSVVQREAYNRLPAQMAVLHQLLRS